MTSAEFSGLFTAKEAKFKSKKSKRIDGNFMVPSESIIAVFNCFWLRISINLSSTIIL